MFVELCNLQGISKGTLYLTYGVDCSRSSVNICQVDMGSGWHYIRNIIYINQKKSCEDESSKVNK